MIKFKPKYLFLALATMFSLPAISDTVVVPSGSTTTPVLPVVTEGAACTATPESNTGIRSDYTAVLTCQGGTWKRHGAAWWREPVASFAALPMTGNQTGEVRLTTDTGRAFTWNGSAWIPLAIDQNGNFSVPGNLTVNGTSTFNGAATFGGATTFNNTVTANSGVTIGNGTAATSTNTLVVNRTATENTACSPNGAVARDGNGMLLSCQSGVWEKAAGNTGAIGGYTFKITGYTSPLFYGVGKVVGNMFYGDLICDPQTVSTNCGTDGRYWCGSSASCAWGAASYYGGAYFHYTVGASALPINTIVKKW